MKRWNLLTAASLVVMAAGFLSAKSGTAFGKLILALGCIGFIIGMIGANRKQYLRCPHCGAPLTPIGRRAGGGVFHLDGLDAIPCPKCGASVSSQELAEKH